MSYSTAAAPDPKPGAPLWWLQRLYDELGARAPKMQQMDAYYYGEHPLPFLTKAHGAKMRDEFRQLLDDSKANFMRLVVDVVEERLGVDGFRLSSTSDEAADQETWDIWQRNGMDSESSIAFVEAIIKGVSYLSVWEDADGPTIAVEDPCQTIVAYTPGTNYKKRDAALKVWVDELSGVRRANVYLPESIYKFQSKATTDAPLDTGAVYAPARDQQKPTWIPVPNDEEVPNRLKVVPIVPLRNRPRLLREGESELSDIYRIQNQINGFLFLLALGGYFGAHKQRWAVGLMIHEDPNGKPVEPFDVDIGKLWVASAGEDGQEVKFGEFSQTDLTGYIKAIEQKVLHIAVTSRTPRHYLFQEGQSPSGDAIQSAESGLVKKVERKQGPFGEGLEEALRLARQFAGNGKTPPDSEIVWSDPQTESIAAVTDAVIKQHEAGLIPWAGALEKLGYSQTTIARFAGMRQADALQKQLLEAGENVNLNIAT